MMELYPGYYPLVSVILPTFNRASYLERSIDSVLNQSLKSWELLIIDDGSYDSTFDLVLKYQETYSNIRYMRHSNRKPPLTLNAGILASCGKYLTFLGSDDEYTADHLMLRKNIIEDDKSIDLLHGGIEIIGDPYVKDKNDLSKNIHLSKCIIGGTLFGKKQVFLELDGFRNIKYSDDSDFYERAERLYKIEEVGFKTYKYYRDTPDSICNNVE